MDLLWLVLGLVVAAILAITVSVTLPVYRKRNIEQSRASLDEVWAVLSRIDNSLEPYLSSKEYLPERIGRPLREEIKTLVERALPSFEKTVRRTHDSAMRKEFESITLAANQLRQKLIVIRKTTPTISRRIESGYVRLKSLGFSTVLTYSCTNLLSKASRIFAILPPLPLSPGNIRDSTRPDLMRVSSW